MGHGIAQVFAQAGHEVLLKGRSEASLAKAHKAMDKNLSRMVEKGKLEAGVKDQVLARIKDSMKYEDCADADLVIEAIAEAPDFPGSWWFSRNQTHRKRSSDGFWGSGFQEA